MKTITMDLSEYDNLIKENKMLKRATKNKLVYVHKSAFFESYVYTDDEAHKELMIKFENLERENERLEKVPGWIRRIFKAD